jgi:hypothetical protein
MINMHILGLPRYWELETTTISLNNGVLAKLDWNETLNWAETNKN